MVRLVLINIASLHLQQHNYENTQAAWTNTKSLATRKPPGPITVATYTQGYSQLVVKSSQTKEADKPASRTLEPRWLEENKTVTIGILRHSEAGHGGGWWHWAMQSEF